MKGLGRALRALKEVLGKNRSLRAGLAAGLAGVLVFAALMAGLGALAPARRSQGEGQTQATENSASADKDEGSTVETGWKASEDTEAARDYKGADASVVELLAAYSWSSSDAVATFGQSKAQVSKGGSPADPVPYEVSQTHDSGENSEALAVEGQAVAATVRSYTFILTLSGTAYPATIKSTQLAGTQQTISLTCDALSSNPLYATSAANELQVKDVGALLPYVGGSATPLEEALRAWASKNSPAADEATWDGVVTVDTASNTATFSLTLAAATRTKVSVTYKAADGTFQVSASR